MTRSASGSFLIHNSLVDRHLPEIGVNSFAVYCCLARLASLSGTCSPSTGMLATQTGLSRRTIFSCLKVLVEKGLIGIEGRSGEDGGTASNLYRLLPVAEGTV